MSAAKHTPGPWSFVDHAWCDKGIYARLHEMEERRIALLHLGEDDSEDAEAVEIANARLIAAAPELLEALHAWRQFIRSGDGALLRKAEQMTDAAIAKATGDGS